MELQPIVGASCAHCKDKILVDLDGKNCKQCGLAVHRRCSKAHKGECTGTPAITHVTRDYDEVPEFAWTPRVIAMMAIAAFVFALGLGMLTASGPEPRPGEEAPKPSSTRVAMEWLAVVAGLGGIAGAYAFERSRQSDAAKKRAG
jgi:hypothetical protein